MGRTSKVVGLGTVVVAFVWLGACTETLAPIAGSTLLDGATPTDVGVTPPIDDDASTPETPSDSGVPDAADADATPAPLVRVAGHVDYGGPVAGASVTVLAPSAQVSVTDQDGDFFFYFPTGTKVVLKVEAPNLFPMIRGVVAGATQRIRTFYLAGPPEVDAADGLGLAIDPAKGMVEVDFRNAQVGGYGVTLTGTSGPLTAGWGIAFDASGDPQSSPTTITGGDGSTLLLGGLPTGTASFAAITPADAGVCQPCDAIELPIQANTVTWFDFEAGSAGCE